MVRSSYRLASMSQMAGGSAAIASMTGMKKR